MGVYIYRYFSMWVHLISGRGRGQTVLKVKPYWLIFNSQLDLGADMGADSQPLHTSVPVSCFEPVSSLSFLLTTAELINQLLGGSTMILLPFIITVGTLVVSLYSAPFIVLYTTGASLGLL